MKIKFSKMAITFIAAAALIIGCVAGGALAYLVGNTDPVTNTFVAGEVKCSVNQTANSATVTNTGNVRAYIRAAVVGNTLNDAGQITGNWTGTVRDQYLLNTEDWTPITQGDVTYYYYNKTTPVEPGDSTSNLFKADAPALDDLLITVFAEAIQADGMPDVTNAQQAFEYASAH